MRYVVKPGPWDVVGDPDLCGSGGGFWDMCVLMDVTILDRNTDLQLHMRTDQASHLGCRLLHVWRRRKEGEKGG